MSEQGVYRKRDGTLLKYSGRRARVCTACEEVFAGVTAFDRHIRRDGKKGGKAVHVAPEVVGLVRNAKGQWSATSPSDRARLTALRAAA